MAQIQTPCSEWDCSDKHSQSQMDVDSGIETMEVDELEGRHEVKRRRMQKDATELDDHTAKCANAIDEHASKTVESTYEQSCKDSYPADGPGFVLIINFKEHRKGSEHDTRRLLEFFHEELGFAIRRPDEDMTESEFIDCLESVKNSLDKTYYCFICIVMGHGDETGIQTKDDKRIPTDRILKTFDNIHMTSFAGKPKWFIINACRGNRYTNTTTSQLKTDKAIDTSQTQKKVAIEGSDVTAFKSTIQGHVSWRDEERGAFFIQTCIDVFTESYTTSDIDDMMRKVNRILQDKVQQVAEKTTTMTRKLHLVKNTNDFSLNKTNVLHSLPCCKCRSLVTTNDHLLKELHETRERHQHRGESD